MPAWLLLALALGASLPAQAQGVLLETPEQLKSVPEPPGFRGLMPASVNLAGSLPPPRSQGETATCTAWAAAYAGASQALRRTGPSKSVTLSPSFVYNRVTADPYCNAVSALSTTLEFLQQRGALPIEEFGFDSGWCGRIPKPAEEQRAAQFRIHGWSRFDASQIELTKGQLARGVPVIFATRVGSRFRAFVGTNAVESDSDPIFGHAMVAIGYDESRKAIRIQNSWGRSWGDGGYAWLSYEFWRKAVQVGYVID